MAVCEEPVCSPHTIRAKLQENRGNRRNHSKEKAQGSQRESTRLAGTINPFTAWFEGCGPTSGPCRTFCWPQKSPKHAKTTPRVLGHLPVTSSTLPTSESGLGRNASQQPCERGGHLRQVPGGANGRNHVRHKRLAEIGEHVLQEAKELGTAELGDGLYQLLLQKRA